LRMVGRKEEGFCTTHAQGKKKKKKVYAPSILQEKGEVAEIKRRRGKKGKKGRKVHFHGAHDTPLKKGRMPAQNGVGGRGGGIPGNQ